MRKLTISDEIEGNLYVISHTSCSKNELDKDNKKLDFLKQLPKHMNLKYEDVWIWMDCFSIPNFFGDGHHPKKIRGYYCSAFRACSRIVPLVERKVQGREADENETIPQEIMREREEAIKEELDQLAKRFIEYENEKKKSGTDPWELTLLIDPSSSNQPKSGRLSRRLPDFLANVERDGAAAAGGPCPKSKSKSEQEAAEEAWLDNSPWARLDILHALCPKKYWPGDESSRWKPGPKGQRFYHYDNEGKESGSVLTTSHLKDPRAPELNTTDLQNSTQTNSTQTAEAQPEAQPEPEAEAGAEPEAGSEAEACEKFSMVEDV